MNNQSVVTDQTQLFSTINIKEGGKQAVQQKQN